MNNLYIITNVLYDWTSGMAVISSPSLERCRELFFEEFDEHYESISYDSAIGKGCYQCYENVNIPEGILQWVRGGG